MTAASAPPLLITRWASRDGEPAALSRDRARLDERGFADLLAEAAHLAGLIGFQDGEGPICSDWRRVLAADPAILLALLATVDIEGRSEGLQALLDRARTDSTAAETEQLLGRLIEGLLRLAGALDEWLAPAAAGAGAALDGHDARRMIEASIETVLGPQLRALLGEIALAQETGLLRHLVADHGRLRPHWRLAAVEIAAAVLRDEVERALVDRLLDQVAEVAESFMLELREISARASASLEHSLGSGRHPPHVALTMAFARIFRHAQDRLNDVPQRIAAFYQEQVLRAAPRPAAPDNVLLAVVPKPGARPRIEAGTEFPAGKDADGAEIAFAADWALDATGATLAEMRTWAPEHGGDGAVMRVAVFAHEGEPDGMVGEGVALAVSPALVIAAPQLRLAGGTRWLELRLACAALPAGLDWAALGASLAVAVSTDQGWLDLAAGEWTVAGDVLTLLLLLPPDLAPVAPCPGGTADAPGEAALRLTLRPEAAAGALFSGLVLSDLALRVAVADLPGLSVSTPAGPASAAGAAPFGIPPAPGGWLRIDHPMLAGPPLDRLALHLDWAALPAGEDGFAGYYHDYLVDSLGRVRDEQPFDNQAFAVTLAAPVPGWDGARALPLFASADPTTPALPPPDPAAPKGDFATLPPPPHPHGPVAPTSRLAATASAETGAPLPDHVLLTLAGPADGFGDALYGPSVAYATQRLAEGEAPARRPGLIRRIVRAIIGFPGLVLRKLGWLDAREEEGAVYVEAGPAIPNPPFRPLLSAIRMDYALTVPGQGLALWHARPFDALRPVSTIAGAPLFAPLPDRATVDIALAGARAGDRQSLLVRLGAAREAAGGDSLPPDVLYLAAEGWRALPPGALLSDGTGGLSATGLLRFALPADAAAVAAGGPLWLRIILPQGARIPPITAITPDAFTATRLLPEAAAKLAPIAPGTIARLPGLPGIARVVQPLPSSGGRPAEEPAMLRRRVAERVRHRGRGVSAWDIERLVLSEFPGVARVRVIEAGGGGEEIKVIVVPAAGGADPPDPDRPRTPAHARGAIAARLQALSSPFARLDVVDPVYVPVDVTAQIFLSDGGAARLQAALADLLSPWAEPGLDLDDRAGEERVRAAIAAFLLARPGVAGIDRLDVRLGEAPGALWRVPVAGEIGVVGIAAERATLPW